MLGSLAIGAIMFVSAIAFGGIGQARAGDAIRVTTPDDEFNADGDCSLREAVMAVNAQAPVDACPGAPGSRNVFVDPGTYVLTIPGAGEDAGATGDLDILNPISIDPTGTGLITIDGGGLDRIFDIHPTAVFGTGLTGVTLQNGDAGAADGGAIRISDVVCDGSPGSRRDIDLSGAVLDGNRAARGGGLHIGACNSVTILFSSIVRNFADEAGGGVSIVGNTVVDFETSTISTNEAGDMGGGAWADIAPDDAGWSLSFSTVAHNRAPNVGGIWSRTLTWAGSSILAANEGGNCGGPGGVSQATSDDESCGGPAEGEMGLGPLTTIGFMPVHVLTAGSPAIEAAGEPIHAGWCGSYGPYDQASTLRPLDGDGDGLALCDAGAIEAAAVDPGPSPGGLPDTSLGAPGRSGSATPGFLVAAALACAASAMAAATLDVGAMIRGA